MKFHGLGRLGYSAAPNYYASNSKSNRLKLQNHATAYDNLLGNDFIQIWDDFMIIRNWKLIQVPAPRHILCHDTGDAFQTAEVMRSHKIPGHGRARPLPCGDFITSNLGNRWEFRKFNKFT